MRKHILQNFTAAVLVVVSLTATADEPRETATPVRWDPNGIPIGAVVCFGSVAERNAAEKAINATSYEPRSLAWKASIKSARSLAAFEFDIPTGFPPKPRKMFEETGDIAKDVDHILSAISRYSSLGDEMRRRLMVSPLAHWRASPEINRNKYQSARTTVILEPTCLVTDVVVARQEAVYFDSAIWEQLPHSDRVTIVIEHLLTLVAKFMHEQTPFRTLVGLLIANSEFGELSEVQRFQLTWPLELPTYRVTIEGNSFLVCRDSFERDGKLKSYVYLSNRESAKIQAGAWSVTPKTDNCGDWVRNGPSIEVEKNGMIRMVHVDVATNGQYELVGDTFFRTNGVLTPETWDAWSIRLRDQEIKIKGKIVVQDGDTLVVEEAESDEVFSNRQGQFRIRYVSTIRYFPNSLRPEKISRVIGKIWFDGRLRESTQQSPFGVVMNRDGRVIELTSVD